MSSAEVLQSQCSQFRLAQCCQVREAIHGQGMACCLHGDMTQDLGLCSMITIGVGHESDSLPIPVLLTKGSRATSRKPALPCASLLWRARHRDMEAACLDLTAKFRSHMVPSSDTNAAAGPASPPLLGLDELRTCTDAPLHSSWAPQIHTSGKGSGALLANDSFSFHGHLLLSCPHPHCCDWQHASVDTLRHWVQEMRYHRQPNDIYIAQMSEVQCMAIP